MTTVKVLLLLSAVVGLSSSQTGVCYQVRSYTQYYYTYVSYMYYYSYGCWIFTCYGSAYSSQLQTRTRTVYYTQFGCCSGYQQNGALLQCNPICYDCDSNHICIAPYTCVCPDGWMGADCSEDINECVNSTYCEQNCNNTIGSYTCSCDDGYSLATDVHSCLGPPQNLTMNATSSTSQHIYWDPPELDPWDGSVVGYRISCSSPFDFTHESVISGGTTEYMLNLLKPFSYYTCCVLAETTNGLSSSSCYTQQTLQDVPDDFPQNITVNNHSAFALFIEWDPPLIPNGIITLYTIYATYENGSDVLTLNSSERSYVLEGLSPHQLVLINMSASTEVGEGPTSHAIAERTSQAVPSEVRNIEVLPISPYIMQVSWTLPEFLNGILSRFEVTVYNEVLQYSYTVFVGPDVTQVNVSENIEPGVPYTVEIKAYTHAGGGLPEKVVVFSEEVVPKATPALTEVKRTDATTAQLKWDLLTLDELGGFLDKYIVIYDELDRYTCPDSLPASSAAVFSEGDAAVITNLDPSMEYCVGVAASTAAGVGNHTQTLIPLYTNILFQVHFGGIHMCTEWVHDDSLEKIADFIDGMTLELSTLCDCHIPANHIADKRMICEDEDLTRVVFQGRMIITEDRNSSQLADDIATWVSTDPHLVIRGVQLEADKTCSTQLSELGDSTCVVIPEPIETSTVNIIPRMTTPGPLETPTMKTEEPSSNATTDNSKSENTVEIPVVHLFGIGGGILGLIALILFATCGIVICKLVRHSKAKAQRYPSHQPKFGLHPGSFGVGKTVENPMYLKPNVIHDEDNEGLIQPGSDDQPDLDGQERGNFTIN